MRTIRCMGRGWWRGAMAAVVMGAVVVMAGCAPIVAPAPTTPAEPAAEPNPIQNVEWLWTSLSNRTTGEVIEVADPASYTIAFSADGTTRGRADCNTFSGTYSQADGFSVTIEALTQDDCGAESMGVMYTDLLGIVVAGGMASADEFALETAGGEQRMMFANGGVAP